MAYFDCIVGGSGKGNTLVVTCADDLAGATIICTNGTKTYTKTCPSTSPYEVTFYGLMAGTYTVSATVSGNTYTTTVVVADIEALLGGFNWKTWVDLSENYTSSDFTDLDDLLSDETAVRELMTIHACVDYLADIATTSADVETIINNDLCAKWINLRDYALDTLYANEIIAGYMDTADKYGYGEWCLMPQVPTMTSNTAPYGEASASSAWDDKPAYYAFDNNGSTNWEARSATDSRLIYHFVSPVEITKASVLAEYNPSYGAGIKNYKYQYSDDGTTWVDVDSTGYTYTNQSGYVDDRTLPPKGKHEYWAIYVIDTYNASKNVTAVTLQFYAYAPKGNVPVMTSNTAPYGTVIGDTQYSGSEPYKAFDGNSSTYYQCGSAKSTAQYWVQYKFTNPVKAKKFHIIAPIDVTSTTTFTIGGSNDGLTWTSLGTYNVGSVGSIVDELLNNDNYYLYYGISFTTGSYGFSFRELQFYGRELSVSVPKMDTNTTPYGEAFSSSNTYSANPAYKAFDNDFSTYWGTSSTTAGQIGYKFPSKMVLKKFHLEMTYYNVPYTCQVKGSNDGITYFDIGDSFVVNSGTKDVDYASNNTEYEYIMLDISVGTSMGIVAESIQFYGLDYSEKEFEEGTTKKWLYDHGVELETFEAYPSYTNYNIGTYSKNSDNIQLDVSGTSNGIALSVQLDCSAYDYLMCKGRKLTNNANNNKLATASTGYLRASTIGSNTIDYTNPKNSIIALDVQSVSQQVYCGVFLETSNTINATSSMFEELWLE